MAKYDHGILGPFRGKVGSVVGYTVRGVHCMRVHTPRVRDARTDAQLAARAVFALAGRIANWLGPVLPRVRRGMHSTAARNMAVRCLIREGELQVQEGKVSGLQVGAMRWMRPDLGAALPALEGLQAQVAGQRVTVQWTGAQSGRVVCGVSSLDGAVGGLVGDVDAGAGTATVDLGQAPVDGGALVLVYAYDPDSGAHSPAGMLRV